MTNVERIQAEGIALLDNSGWEPQLVEALKETFNDFTSQAFYDAMYEHTSLELMVTQRGDKIIFIHWKSNRLDTYVDIYPDHHAGWTLSAGKWVGEEFDCCESAGFGGDGRYTYERDYRIDSDAVIENDEWAFHFYWWLEDYQFATKEERAIKYQYPSDHPGVTEEILYINPKILKKNKTKRSRRL